MPEVPPSVPKVPSARIHQLKNHFIYKGICIFMKFIKNFYCVSSRVENTGQLYGCFKIGPFLGHQSLTFANALRRTLLADQSKCTLDAVQIYGVTHEFSSLVGIRESLIDILLNLEKIIFQTTQPITKPQIGLIHYHGPGILRAQHISLPSGWRCVRPNQYIATFEVDGQLLLKLFFSPNLEKLSDQLPVLLAKTHNPFFIKTFPLTLQKKNVRIQKFKMMNCFSNNFLRIFNNHRLKTWKILDHFFLPKFQRRSNTKYPLSSKFKSPSFSFRPSKTLESIVYSRTLETQNPLKKKRNLVQYEIFDQIFQKQENFLFLKSPRCAIEKAHYTLQTENPSSDFSLNSSHQTYIFFEIWTDGSLHPQKAILKALNELLLEIFAYSLQITKSEKIHFLKAKEIMKFSKEQFREKFLNLEIGNFSLDLETYIFLKKKKIYKIVDFCVFFQNENRDKLSALLKKTLYKFHFFIHSILSER